MSEVFKAHIFHIEGTEFDHPYFEGEVEGVYIPTNIVELQNHPVEFVGETRKDVIEKMITYLKGTGKSGVLRLV